MQTTVAIPGMHCASCAKLIESVSNDFPSIESIDVNITAKTATITHADDFILSDWAHAIEELGDTYRVQRVSKE